MGEALVVDDDRVAVPEIDGGKIRGQDLLGLDIIGATAGLIGILSSIVEQRIERGIGIVAAVGSLG